MTATDLFLFQVIIFGIFDDFLDLVDDFLLFRCGSRGDVGFGQNPVDSLCKKDRISRHTARSTPFSNIQNEKNVHGQTF